MLMCRPNNRAHQSINDWRQRHHHDPPLPLEAPPSGARQARGTHKEDTQPRRHTRRHEQAIKQRHTANESPATSPFATPKRARWARTGWCMSTPPLSDHRGGANPLRQQISFDGRTVATRPTLGARGPELSSRHPAHATSLACRRLILQATQGLAGSQRRCPASETWAAAPAPGPPHGRGSGGSRPAPPSRPVRPGPLRLTWPPR
jgi:hypothetical protein